jgi:hypothetical protein
MLQVKRRPYSIVLLDEVEKLTDGWLHTLPYLSVHSNLLNPYAAGEAPAIQHCAAG